MRQTRRHFIATGAATTGAAMILPFAARAAAHASDQFETDAGTITVHPVEHASFVMETPKGVIYVDTVGDPERYSDFPAPDLILITHEHGDHYNAETIAALMGETTTLLTNPAVSEMLPADLSEGAVVLANGENADWEGVSIDAIPAYNITEGRTDYHPEGRDNGYVLGFEGFRVYISGDTEATDEMRALEDIDLAFVCMNLPFTMDAEQAAEGVSAFAPAVVYPYHFRGRDGGTQDPAAFAEMVEGETQVRQAEWYPNGMG